jgi:hypothetical protein
MLTELIASLALKTGLGVPVVKRLAVGVGILLAIGAAILAWNLWLRGHDKDVIEGHEQKIEAKVQKQGRAADARLSERKEAAAAAQVEERKEFDNATAHLPKSGLTARQRVDACNKLRRQRTDPAVLARAKCL